MKKKKYQCLCCGYYTLDETACDVCAVCGWEDSGITDLDVYDGLNHGENLKGITLREGKRNFHEFGASHKLRLPYVRNPYPYEMQKSNNKFIVIEFDWPSLDEILNVLRSVFYGKISRAKAGAWANEIYDNKFIADKIEGYYPMGICHSVAGEIVLEEVEDILFKMILLDDEEDDNEEDDNDKGGKDEGAKNEDEKNKDVIELIKKIEWLKTKYL